MHAHLFCRPTGVELVAPLLQPIDISLGGLRIHGHEERQVGSVLRLDAFFPHVARVTLATEVVWIKALDNDAPQSFDMGLAFVGLSPAAKDTLRMLLGAAEHENAREPIIEPAQAPVQSSVRLTPDEPIRKVRPRRGPGGTGGSNLPARRQSTGGESFAIDVEIDNALARWDDSAASQAAPSFAPRRGGNPPSTERPAAGAILPTTPRQSRGGAVPEESDAPVITQYEIDPSRYVLDRYLAGDYAEALDIADVVLMQTPGNLLVRECRDRCHDALAKSYAEKVGPLGRVPVVLAENAETRCAPIDHRASFLLTLVDGASTLEGILDACGMPRLDALRIVQEMVQRKIIGFG